MKLGFYPKLAADGMRKNSRLYIPYLLTCIGMVMMTYLINFLKLSDAVAALPGGYMIRELMNIGILIMTFFSTLFLFYTNSFLSRRRKKEFGLYHILGMGKWNLSRILLWESLFVAVISLALGLFFGIAVSKLAELLLINMMKGAVDYNLSVSVDSIIYTVCPFLVIFGLIFLNMLRQVWFSSTVSLLKSENTGEKPPKANWFLGLAGIAILAVAYYIAVTIENPIVALTAFMIAVLLVILATYLIMISGSVLLCRILQKRKRYYYKANHFVSVSSMVYRMKRNGAGLASICVLATMVLVMISSTSALFLGGESVIMNRYPREIDIWFRMYEDKDMTEEDKAAFEGRIDAVLDTFGTEKTNVMKYYSVNVAGMLTGGEVIYDVNVVDEMNLSTFSDVHNFYVISIEDYNYMMGTKETLKDDEVLIFAPRNTFRSDTFRFSGQKEYKVKEIIKDCFISPDIAMDIVPSVVVIASDVKEVTDGLVTAEGPATFKKWYCCFDTTLSAEENIALHEAIITDILAYKNDGHDTFKVDVESRDFERQDFYGLYGGLFALGIILSVVFIFAAVLIIYYKQITEGYEDQARFDIMQKVGMTKRDIRKSINSQLLTVFFLPLVCAGLHLAFAFPIIEKLLLLFNLNNHVLFVGTTIGSFLVFALFYAIVYRITSNAYYKIVSGGRETMA